MWGKATAGIFAGFFAAAGCVGLGMWALPGSWEGTLVPGLLFFFPLWITMASCSFFFTSGRAAWVWLSALALATLCLLWAGQMLKWFV